MLHNPDNNNNNIDLFSDVICKKVELVGKDYFYILYFTDEKNALFSQKVLAKYDINKNFNKELCRIELSGKEWLSLRKKIRAEANQIQPNGNFVFKSIRLDEQNYFRRWLEMVTSTDKKQKKHPLRLGLQEQITVTGKGIFRRKNFAITDKRQALPLKMPQYTAEEKKGFSNFQSATLALPHFQPLVFGFDKRKHKLIGVILDEKDILFSDRNYLYDGGTIGRPFDFSSLESAKKYYDEKVGKRLFSADDIDDFKSEIAKPRNGKSYNEVLVRMRFNPETFKIFIASDTLEARLAAKEYARITKNYLRDHNLLPENYELPICFYTPHNPKLHFKAYTENEYNMDVLEANGIYSSSIEYKNNIKYENHDFEFLLALSPEQIKHELDTSNYNPPLIVYLLLNGYTHIFHSLLDRIGTDVRPCTWSDVYQRTVSLRLCYRSAIL